ncbi:MAG: TetR/AcrR family transcriptional regulator [Spirochaetaceae bacterium]|jgi:AcrR family transcriptional regulator|nr:TetR/AcrR family transcriptional regulator [Spirochaetaceae bacterium]
MTNDEIIKTTFRVWGESLYQSTSLSDVASALGVTKPALYRHFKNKDLLLGAMYSSFYDRFAEFIRADYEFCLKCNDEIEKELRIARVIAEYLARNREDFLFGVILVHGNQETGFNFLKQLQKRGVDMLKVFPQSSESAIHPPDFQLVLTTVYFMLAAFHKNRAKNNVTSLGDEILSVFVDQVEERICTGLALPAEKINALDYESLEKAVVFSPCTCTGNETNKIIEAVIGALAEAGPWKFSMEMVAKRSGLSKSSLYSHFESKEEMLKEALYGEIGRVTSYAEHCSLLSKQPEEQLYLTLIGIVAYLRKKSEVLLIFDRFRTRRPVFKTDKCGKGKFTAQIHRTFSQIKNADGTLMISERNTEWILFLIVNLLQRRQAGMSYADIPNESFRMLFRFIARGLKNM